MNELNRGLALLIRIFIATLPDELLLENEEAIRELVALSQTCGERGRGAVGYDLSARGKAALKRADNLPDVFGTAVTVNLNNEPR